MIALNWAGLVKRTDTKASSDKDSDPTEEELNLLWKFSILLFIDLSKIRHNSGLQQVLSDQIVMRCKNDIKPLMQYIGQQQENCCIILDGWDEYDPSSCREVTELANGLLWPDAYTMVTSRIREQMVLPKHLDHQALVAGFSKEKAILFISKIFKAFQHSDENQDMNLFINKHNLWDFFLIPLMLSFLCTLHMSGLKLQGKVTLLFTSIIQCAIAKQKLNYNELESSNLDDVPLEKYKEELIALGKLAASGLLGTNTKTAFDEKLVNKTVRDSGLRLGLLSMVKSHDPTGSVIYQFHHRSVQEYIAAIYLSNESSKFIQYLDSMVKIYDHRLLIMFICGLNPSFGQSVMERIQQVSESSSATAAQCPQFSFRGWETDNPDDINLAKRHADKATETETFVIQCCWETVKSAEDKTNLSAQFPFSQQYTKGRPVQILPKFDFKVLHVSQIIQLVDFNYIEFRSSAEICVVYNLEIKSENSDRVSKLFQHIKDCPIVSFVIANVTCGIRCNVLTDLIKHHNRIMAFNMFYTTINKCDMKAVLKHLSSQGRMLALNLCSVKLSDCETALIELIKTSKSSLHILNLKNLQFQSHETSMSHAISNLEHLATLSLDGTDLSQTDSFPKCLMSVKCLKYLSLFATKLTEGQTRDMVAQLPSFKLLWLNLSGLPLGSAVCQLKQALPKLTLLKWLCIGEANLDTEDLVQIFASIPPCLQVIWAFENDVNDAIVDVDKVLLSHKCLRYVLLDLSSIQKTAYDRLKESCQDQEIVLIGNWDEAKTHGPSLAQINKGIENECE